MIICHAMPSSFPCHMPVYYYLVAIICVTLPFMPFYLFGFLYYLFIYKILEEEERRGGGGSSALTVSVWCGFLSSMCPSLLLLSSLSSSFLCCCGDRGRGGGGGQALLSVGRAVTLASSLERALAALFYPLAGIC